MTAAEVARQLAERSGRKVDVLVTTGTAVSVVVVRMPRALPDKLGVPDGRDIWGRVHGWAQVMAGIDEADALGVPAIVSWNGPELPEDREMAKGSKKGGGKRC